MLVVFLLWKCEGTFPALVRLRLSMISHFMFLF